jgi:nucleotide-binding universal stress UspA family protein
MSKIKNILVPTDFSEDSHHALAAANSLALKFDAEIDLIYVVPSLQTFLRFITADMNTEYMDTLIDQAEKMIQVELNSLDEKNQGEATIKMEKKPGEAILEHLKSKKYDLVVMGSRGSDKTKLGRGSTAQYVIRGSDVPVLCVDKELLSRNMKTILVPTDGSELSFTALSTAAIMAKLWDADIHLLYVHEYRGGLVENVHMPEEGMQKDLVYERLMMKLDRFMKKSKTGGLQLKRGEELFRDMLVLDEPGEANEIVLITEVVSGFSSHFEIEQYANSTADLVVMATHGHSGFAHMMLGSVTEKVIQHVNKPVLTVRPFEADFLLSKSGADEPKKKTETIPPWHWIGM